MLELSMLGGLSSLVDLLDKAYRTISTSAVKETKISILELCCIVNDTVIAAERLLEKIGKAKTIEEIDAEEFDWRFAMIELKVQLGRLYRMNSIIMDNDLVNVNSSLKKQFKELIEWKEGILFGYGAMIQFFYMFGISDISKNGTPEQKQFDLLRFCFFNSKPSSDINNDEIISNISSLKLSLCQLEDDVKQFLTADEIIRFSRQARKRANEYSVTDPALLLKESDSK